VDIYILIDIKNKIWRTVGDSHLRFKEDPIRIMRALRQCAQLYFKIDEGTQLAMIQHKNLIPIDVRLMDEIIKMLNSRYSKDVVSIFYKINVLNLSSESYNLIDKNCQMNYTFSIRIRLSLLFYGSSNKINYNMISAAPSFSKHDTKFIQICFMFP